MLHWRHLLDALREWRMLVGLQAWGLDVLLGVKGRVQVAIAHIACEHRCQESMSDAW